MDVDLISLTTIISKPILFLLSFDLTIVAKLTSSSSQNNQTRLLSPIFALNGPTVYIAKALARTFYQQGSQASLYRESLWYLHFGILDNSKL